MLFLASSFVYGGVPTTRQMILGAIFFILVYLAPLIIMQLSLHRFPRKWRSGIATTLAIGFTLLALATPNGGLNESTALFFATIAVAASIDLFHLDGPFRQIGLFTLIFSRLVLIGATGPAFVHALLASHRY